MSSFDDNQYSAQFTYLATKLEQYLRKNGVSCEDADMIIEESSALYFEKVRRSKNPFQFLRKQDPAYVFVDSVWKVISIHLPEATPTFGSHSAIAKAIR